MSSGGNKTGGQDFERADNNYYLSFKNQYVSISNILCSFIMNQKRPQTSANPHIKVTPNKNYLISIFNNQRVEQTLSQIEYKNNRSLNLASKDQSNPHQKKQSFRSFIRERRSYIPSKERQKYIDLREEMLELVQQLQAQSDEIELSSFYKMKEQVIMKFLNHFIDNLSKEHLQKAQLLVLAWKNMFLLVEKTLEKICKRAQSDENTSLAEQAYMHKQYQNFLNECIKQKDAVVQQNNKKEKFMKILVAKIRQYKKEIKKMEDNLRIAAEKLNQFRQGYLEIQIQCINLTMELRNLSEETAKMMVQRKMALALEKSKQYKILQSKKKMKKQLRQEAVHAEGTQNNRLKEEFYEAYKSNAHEKPQAVTKVVGRLIQAILDKEEAQPIDYTIFNQNLIENKFLQGELMVDVATDMQGFYIDKADKKVGINAQQKFIHEMTKIRGVQTATIQKPPPIKTDTIGFQCQFKSVICHNFQIKRSVDLSFLFENTLKTSTAKYRQTFLFKSIKQIPNYQRLKKRHTKRQSINNGNSNNNSNVQLNEIESEDQSEVDIKIDESQEKENIKNDEKLSVPQPVKNNQLFASTGGKKIKKLASTFNNKVAFMGISTNFNGYDQRYSKKQVEIALINEENKGGKNKAESEASDEISSMHELDVKVQKKISNKSLRTTNKISPDNIITVQPILKARNNASVDKIKYNQTPPTNISKAIKYKKDKQQKSMNVNINTVNNLATNDKLSSNLQPNEQIIYRPHKTKAENLTKSTHMFAHDLMKEIKLDLDELYEETMAEIAKIRDTPGTKNLSKIKDLGKIVESVLQVAVRYFESTGAGKNFFYYLHEVINNSYGITSNAYLRRKVINFLKEVYQFRQQSIVLSLFLVMMGLDEKGYRILEYSSQNNDLLIQLMKKMCINFKLPFRLEELRLGIENLEQNITKQLEKNDFCDAFIFELMKKIHSINYSGTGNKSQQVFQLLYTVSKHLVQIQSTIVNSYEPIMNLLVTSCENQIPRQFIEFILELHFFQPEEQCSIYSTLNQMCFGKPNGRYLDRSQFAYFCCQRQILDFSRLYYRVLNLFKLTQNDNIFKVITLPKLRSMKLEELPEDVLEKIFAQCETINEANALFHALLKKNLLILIFLKAQNHVCEEFVKDLVGSQVCQLTEMWKNIAT